MSSTYYKIFVPKS